METKTLLIVDKLSELQDTIESQLSDYHLDVLGRADNGRDAMRMVNEQLPDLVTLDTTIPDMDSLTCLKNILEAHPTTKVIVITTLSDKLASLQALDKGAHSFLYKPVTHERLTKTFRELLSQN